MNLDGIYNFLNVVVLPFWLLMILAPRWEGTQKVMRSLWPVAIVPVIYVGLIAALVVDPPAVPLDFTLSGVAAMLGTRQAAVLIWAHILALDLFAARWVYLDGPGVGVPTWVLSLMVFSIMMAGPAGLLLYFLVRRRTHKGQPGV